MSKYKIALLPGDGIGPEVVTATVRVLEEVGFEADYTPGDVGWHFWCTQGNPLPDETLDLVRASDATLFGAITSKPAGDADAELAPELKDKGFVYRSPIVRLRQELDLWACIRPCASMVGVPGAVEDLETIIFRENTEGEYTGLEFDSVSGSFRSALSEHKSFAKFDEHNDEDLAVSCRIVSKASSERIARAAFEYAKKHNKAHVTLLEKANVMRASGALVRDAARKVAAEFSDVAFHEDHIDAACMHAVRDPKRYSVVVAGNLFGDIFSDLCAGLAGGLGFAPSGNIGDNAAVFEPTHGSAPDIAGKGIANPTGTILAACMMLEHLGEADKASKLRTAIAHVLEQGGVRTPDMGGSATTEQLTQAVIAAL